MKWLLVSVVVLAVVLVVGGYLLPSGYRVERSVVVNAAPEKVFPFVSDPRAWAKWTVWNRRDPAMKMTYGGPASGQGAKWSWVSKTEGSGDMEFTRAEAPKIIEYSLSFPEFGTKSKGALVFAAEGSGTRVTWSNEGDMGPNPLMHWMAAMMDRMVGPDFEGGLAGLKALAEKG
jgi:uncharacterized protein YndB with AHSA1/START domain